MIRRRRIDSDARSIKWPRLVDSTPQDDVFDRRTESLAVNLLNIDLNLLRSLAKRLGCSDTGLTLLVIFTFVYGRYPLVRMRRARTGLFKRFPSHDPDPFSSLVPNSEGIAVLAVPRQLLTDLDVLAQRQSLDSIQLVGFVLTRFLEGHLAAADGALEVLPE